jgi:hypothetical protein
VDSIGLRVRKDRHYIVESKDHGNRQRLRDLVSVGTARNGRETDSDLNDVLAVRRIKSSTM